MGTGLDMYNMTRLTRGCRALIEKNVKKNIYITIFIIYLYHMKLTKVCIFKYKETYELDHFLNYKTGYHKRKIIRCMKVYKMNGG